MRKSTFQRASDTFGDLARLAFTAVAAVFLFLVLLLLGNLALYTIARITESLFELFRLLFKA